MLAKYACTDDRSYGRVHQEPVPKNRSEYQRDRDRIIHSAAFRRLEYKTQVFINHEGDLFRTRLTHSIEVAQIGRSIARALNLNEDLTEAISLAHDLGHTPFGHAGQHALNECMQAYGGFEHNLQSLRVVQELEERYAGFEGLNLMFETREGILKHCSLPNAKTLGKLGERFLKKQQPNLEAQIANLADEIAYNNHDVDDSLRYGLISIENIRDTAIFNEQYSQVLEQYPDIHPRIQIHETIRHMIDTFVTDVINTSRRLIEESGAKSVDDVRQAAPLIAYSSELGKKSRELKTFLRKNIYEDYRVQRMSHKAHKVIREMFALFMDNTKLLPDQYQDKIRSTDSNLPAEAHRARVIADYIAGMTDRYAIQEYARLFSPGELTLDME